jgi:hypothetical protein
MLRGLMALPGAYLRTEAAKSERMGSTPEVIYRRSSLRGTETSRRAPRDT